MVERQPRILIVDDQPDALVILRNILERAGYSVITAYGGVDALRRLETQQFDLIITDLAMPEVSGVDIVDRVKRDPRHSGIPVIALTAYVWDSISQSAGTSGCDAFLNKPIDKKRLLEEVAKWVHR